MVARLEISGSGAVRVSAPNAIVETEATPASERRELKAKLMQGLAQSWPQVGALALDFDGKAFRKPGGVAPQLEWNADEKRMTLVYYSGNRVSVHIPLTAVVNFNDGAS